MFAPIVPEEDTFSATESENELFAKKELLTELLPKQNTEENITAIKIAAVKILSKLYTALLCNLISPPGVIIVKQYNKYILII